MDIVSAAPSIDPLDKEEQCGKTAKEVIQGRIRAVTGFSISGALRKFWKRQEPDAFITEISAPLKAFPSCVSSFAAFPELMCGTG